MPVYTNWEIEYTYIKLDQKFTTNNFINKWKKLQKLWLHALKME